MLVDLDYLMDPFSSMIPEPSPQRKDHSPGWRTTLGPNAEQHAGGGGREEEDHDGDAAAVVVGEQQPTSSSSTYKQ